MENKERTRTHQDARELMAQLQQEAIECIEAFLTSRSIDADLRNQTDVPELTDQFVMSMLATNRNTDLLRQELLKDKELILSQRDQLQAQSVCYQDNLTEIQLLKAQVKAMEHATEKDVDRMERAAIQVESLNEECNRLKAQVVSREKEVDVMMAQRNLAEAKLATCQERCTELERVMKKLSQCPDWSAALESYNCGVATSEDGYRAAWWKVSLAAKDALTPTERPPA